MMQDRVEIAIEKKVWEVPSLEKLPITMTLLGGSGDESNSDYGPTVG